MMSNERRNYQGKAFLIKLSIAKNEQDEMNVMLQKKE